MAEKIAAAVIGCGWAGKIHARAYSQDPAVTLRAVCDPDIDRAIQLAIQSGCNAYDSVEKMLAAEKLDIASIASPTETHVEIGRLCLNAGIAPFCEKPLSRDVESARSLVELAHFKGLPLGVNYNRRFAAGYVRAKERLISAGRIHFLSAILAQNVPLAQTAELRAGLSDVFLVFDGCSHLLDLVRFLIGEIVGVQAIGSKAVPGQLWTDIQISLQFECGALGSLICSLAGPEWGQLPIERLEIATESQRIVVNNIIQGIEWWSYRDDEIQRWTPNIFMHVSYEDSIVASVGAWVNAVKEGSPPPIRGEDGLSAVILCKKVVEALCNATT
jgi:UDP-N-acetylglucosamine 3-dehydrogenase